MGRGLGGVARIDGGVTHTFRRQSVCDRGRMNTKMVYGVCNAEAGAYHTTQAYSAELQHYYAQCQGQEPVQSQTYLAAPENHRTQGSNGGGTQEPHVASYTNLDEYASYGGQHASQPHYDYSASVQAGQVPPACTPPTTPAYGYLDPAAQYRHMSMGLYAHHEGVRDACSMSAMMGASTPHGLPHHQPQQSVPTYKWMQVKRNVPKPGINIDFLSIMYNTQTYNIESILKKNLGLCTCHLSAP